MFPLISTQASSMNAKHWPQSWACIRQSTLSLGSKCLLVGQNPVGQVCTSAVAVLALKEHIEPLVLPGMQNWWCRWRAQFLVAGRSTGNRPLTRALVLVPPGTRPIAMNPGTQPTPYEWVATRHWDTISLMQAPTSSTIQDMISQDAEHCFLSSSGRLPVEGHLWRLDILAIAACAWILPQTSGVVG